MNQSCDYIKKLFHHPTVNFQTSTWFYIAYKDAHYFFIFVLLVAISGSECCSNKLDGKCDCFVSDE